MTGTSCGWKRKLAERSLLGLSRSSSPVRAQLENVLVILGIGYCSADGSAIETNKTYFMCVHEPLCVM